LSNLLSPADKSICETKIGAVFPRALKNKDLVDKVSKNLEKYGFGRSTLFVTSLGADELNRCLEEDFTSVYGDHFSMGGLGGFPFAGHTAFNTMASHIPDGGSCLLVFGPHVGVDSTGAVGTVERRGRAKGGPCCGSAVVAASYVAAVKNGKIEKAAPPDVATDAQQNYVGNMLLPYAPRLEKATDRMVELPYAMYDAQKKMMGDIIRAGASNVAGKIAVLGGIQINTPEGESDYFKPMSFEVYDNTGTLLEDLTPKL
jgi:Limiting CO2-inducible proteins B/C beta carbonyic anhydrases